MKKLNKFFNLGIFIITCFTVLVGLSSLTSCNTLPVGNPVDPVELLDENSDFYVSIPKSVDPQLVRNIIEKALPGLSDSNINQIYDRTHTVYAGITLTSSGTVVQAAIEGDVPVNFLPKLLTKKNGWQIRDYAPEGSVSHKVYSANGIDLSFPSKNIACVGRDIDEMLKKYNLLAFTPETLEPLDKNKINPANNFNSFLKEDETEIRFYAKNPLAFIKALTGLSLNLSLIEIGGGFTENSSNTDEYLLDIYFNFNEKKYLRAGKALLSLAFGLSKAQVELLGTTGLKVSDIKINKNLFYKLFVL